jgi:hypothetical protein
MENTPTSNTSESLVDLPIAQIKDNPDNPRHLITPEMTEAMAASLKTVGLKNAIKVRKLEVRSGELGVAEKGEKNQEKAELGNDGPYEYEVISGHIRLAGAKMLGWTTIKALVKDLTPQEALLEAILDNRGQEMTWFDLYLSIEALMKADPNLTQQEVGNQLEIDRSVVSRALKLLGVLNPISRTLICENFTKPDGYHVPENCVRRLGDLERSQSPHLQDLVQRALGVVLRKKMGEPQVAKMVAEILKTGINPEAYENELSALKQRKAVKGVDPDDPNGEYWQNLPSNVQVKWNDQSYRVTMDLSPSEAPVGVYGAMAWLEHMKHKAVGTHDPRYAKALPQLTERNQKAYGQEQKRQLEVRSAGLGVKEKQVAAQTEAQPTTQRTEQSKAGEEALSKTGVASSPFAKASGDKPSSRLSPEAARPSEPGERSGIAQGDNDGLETLEQPSSTNQPTAVPAKGGGLGGLVMQAIKNRIGSNAGEVESNAANALVNDAQRAANTLVRQGMRKVIKDLI